MQHSGSATSSLSDTSLMAMLTSAASWTSSRPTWPGTHRPISSPASAGGALPSGLPAGPTIDPSGPEAAPASPSVMRGSASRKKTRVISGPTFDASSPSARLQSSLGSRLRARLEGRGFQECVLTWKQWAMPSGPPICALRVSERRTAGNGSGLLPTPTAKANMDAPSMQKWPRYRRLFPTPTASRWDGLQSHGVNVISGPMNPEWIAWLMGFPIAWISCAGSATRSSRKSQPSSFAPGSTAGPEGDPLA